MVTKIAGSFISLIFRKVENFDFNPELFGDCFCQEPMWDRFCWKKTKRCLLIIFHCTRNTELRDLRDLLQNCATRRLLAVALLGLDGLICVIYRYINRMIAVLYIIYGTSPILAQYHMKSRNQQSIHLFCRFRLFRPSLHLTPAPNTHGPAGTVVALLVLAPAPGRHVDSDYLRGKSPTKSYGLPQVGDEKIDLLLLLLTKFHKSICRRKECHQYAELRLPLKCVSCNKKNNNSIQPFIVSTFLQPTFHSLAPRLAIMRLLKVDPIGSRLVVELW